MSEGPDLGGTTVSQMTFERLRSFLGLLERWNRSINLVSRSTLPEAWERHVLDSAQLVSLAPQHPGNWVDLGSGGGFPGIVVAIILAETSPGSVVTLVESDRRKASFLREAARTVGIRASVIGERIETVPPQQADVVSARALAPLDRLLPMVHRHKGSAGIALLPKGSRADSELALAAEAWSFSVERLASRTETTAEILRLRELEHV